MNQTKEFEGINNTFSLSSEYAFTYNTMHVC